MSKSKFVDTVDEVWMLRLTRWLIKRWYRRYSPGHVASIMNEEAEKASGRYEGKLRYSVLVTLWERGKFDFLNVTKSGAHDKKSIDTAVSMLKGAITDLQGKSVRVKEVL